jgi:hypothetical protein
MVANYAGYAVLEEVTYKGNSLTGIPLLTIYLRRYIWI